MESVSESVYWSSIISDALIAVAYFAIPIQIVYYKSRNPVKLGRGINIVLSLFCLFIFACGVTHALNIVQLITQRWVWSAGAKIFTALVSLVTSAAMALVIPRMLKAKQTFQSTLRASAIMQQLYDSTTKIRSSMNVGDILSTLVEEIGVFWHVDASIAVMNRGDTVKWWIDKPRGSRKQRQFVKRFQWWDRDVEQTQDVLTDLVINYQEQGDIVRIDDMGNLFFNPSESLDNTSGDEEVWDKSEIPRDLESVESQILDTMPVYARFFTLLVSNTPSEPTKRGGHFRRLSSYTNDFEKVTLCFLSHSHKHLSKIDTDNPFFQQMIDSATVGIQQAMEANWAQIARERTMFLARMSHEIRTPMTGILGMLTMLTESGGLTLTQREYVDSCRRSSKSLLTVLNDILLFSKADANAIALERVPFNLNTLIEDVVAISSTKVLDTSACRVMYEIKEDVPLMVVGDPTRLRQILFNLMSNAVKFTTRGFVMLSVTREKCPPPRSNANDVRLSFQVQDTGIGMTETQMKTIFRAFAQADTSTSRLHGGTGLGLAVCKYLASLFDATIQVSSKVHQGSCFTCTNTLFQVQSTWTSAPLCKKFDLDNNIVPFDNSFKPKVCVCGNDSNTKRNLYQVCMLLQCEWTESIVSADIVIFLDIETGKRVMDVCGATKRILVCDPSQITHQTKYNAILSTPVRRSQAMLVIHRLCRETMSNTNETQSIGSLEPIDTSLSGLQFAVLTLAHPSDKSPVLESKQHSAHWINQSRASESSHSHDSKISTNSPRVSWTGTQLRQLLKSTNAIAIACNTIHEAQECHVVVTDWDSVQKLTLEDLELIQDKLIVYSESITRDVEQWSRRTRVPTIHCDLGELLTVVDQRILFSHLQHYVIAEDDKTNQLVLKYMIKNHLGDPSTIVETSNGQECTEVVKSNQPVDIVVIDMHMPIMNGIEATEKIKAYNANIIVVGVTGDSYQKNVCDMWTAQGVDGIIDKPINPVQMRRCIREIIIQKYLL